MAQGNWLSFSQYPLETSFRSYQPTPPIPFENSSDLYNQYLFNTFYTNDESTTKQPHYSIPNSEQNKQPQFVDLSNLSSHFQPQVPKLEDFLSLAQTHTQDDDSSLQDLNQITASTGFQTAFSTNSGSEVEDSATGDRFESRNNELMLCDNSQSLSLGVGQNTDNCIVSVEPADIPKALTSDTFGQRTSVYRGVTRHRWTGRYEAHLWDNSCRREGQSRKGRQVYLGGYDKEDKAARAYDLAALKYWGPSATTNFPISTYTQELEEMKNMTKQEFIASLRRKSSGFSRGASVYRGVTRHHQQGRWQARIGRVAGNKDLYLGTFGTEEEAAEAYDIAAIKFRGLNAVTNFEMNRYDVEAIANSALPIGAVAKRLKLSLEAEAALPISAQEFQQPQSSNSSTSVVVHTSVTSAMSYEASMALYHQNLLQHYHSAPICSSDSTSSTAVTSMAMLPQPEFPNRNFLYGFPAPINMDSQFSNNETNGNYLQWNMGSSSN